MAQSLLYRDVASIPTAAEDYREVEGLEQLLLQSLEHELNAVEVYRAALPCAVDEALREEWEQYLAETRNHVDVLTELCESLRVDFTRDTAGRKAVRQIGSAILASIERAAAENDPTIAQLVACECVMLIETKDHLNWALIGARIRKTFDAPAVLKLACEQMEGEEDEHLYHARSWTRDLWKQRLSTPTSLGADARLRALRSVRN